MGKLNLNRGHEMRRRLFALPAVMTAAAFVGFGTLELMDVQTGQEAERSDYHKQRHNTEPVQPVEPVQSVLRTSNRDRLAICITTDGVPEAAGDLAAMNILATWPQVAANPLWQWAGITNAPPLVEAGCPSGRHTMTQQLAHSMPICCFLHKDTR